MDDLIQRLTDTWTGVEHSIMNNALTVDQHRRRLHTCTQATHMNYCDINELKRR